MPDQSARGVREHYIF